MAAFNSSVLILRVSGKWEVKARVLILFIWSMVFEFNSFQKLHALSVSLSYFSMTLVGLHNSIQILDLLDKPILRKHSILKQFFASIIANGGWIGI